MAKRDSTKVLWQVQARKTRQNKWENRGRFETREDAREKCAELREGWVEVCAADLKETPIYGFGNTRVVSVVKE